MCTEYPCEWNKCMHWLFGLYVLRYAVKVKEAVDVIHWTALPCPQISSLFAVHSKIIWISHIWQYTQRLGITADRCLIKRDGCCHLLSSSFFVFLTKFMIAMSDMVLSQWWGVKVSSQGQITLIYPVYRLKTDYRRMTE